MTITITHVFWLLLVGVVAYVFMQYRGQVIARTLASNIVTVQIKNEDTTVKLLEIHQAILSILKTFQAGNECITALGEKVSQNARDTLECKDVAEQQKVKLGVMSDEVYERAFSRLQEEIKALEVRLASKTGGTLMEQLQGLSVEQIMELAKKSGNVVEKIGPIWDLLGKIQKASTPKS